MATPIVVKPQEQSPIVVSGGNSSTPLKVTQKEPSKITIKDDEDATHIVVDNNGVDYKRVERIVDDKIINKLNLKADKSDTYTKSEVDALVAGGGGGSGEDNGIVIPADTYTMEIDGETYYALSGISANKMDLFIDYYDRYDNICNGFAFTTNSRDVAFKITSDYFREDVGDVYMQLEPDGKRYQIYDDSGDYGFTKSAERRFHTLYWDSEMIKFDLKKIINCGTELANKQDIFVSISSKEEVKIINYGKHCAPLFAKQDGRPNRFEIYSYSEDCGLFLVTNCDATQVKLHFSSYLPYALPKHQNIFVTNNSIKPAYYANKMYFVRTNKVGSCFDFVGHFHDSVISIAGDSKCQFQNKDGVLVNKLFNYSELPSIFVTGDLNVRGEYVIRQEEPPIPMNKKGYIYNNGLIYLGTNIYASNLFVDKYSACVYRYRKNRRSNGFRYIKYRKIKGALEGRKLWGNLYIQSKSKTGVRSVFTSVVKVSYNFREERLTMVKT
jgi:hypothetical protein